MYVELDRRGGGPVASGSLPDWVRVTDESIAVRGGDALEHDTYVGMDEDTVFVSSQLPELIARMSRFSAPTVSRTAVSYLLGDGFVPIPFSVFGDVHRLGAGDRVSINTVDGDLEFASDYPWINSRSRQDEQPSTKRLLGLITASLERRLDAAGRRGLLMMSSGKDSVALAVGLAELGYDIPCFTYKASEDDVEHEHAASICRRLGLRHETVAMPREPSVIRSHLLEFFGSAVAPSADHAIVPFVVTVAESGITQGAIIDGGGNDGYMGYIRSRNRRRKRRFRIRGRWLQTAVARSTRIDSRLNYLARSRSAADFPGRNMRIHEIRRILDEAVDPADLWRKIDRRLAGQSDIDRAMRNMVHQIEGARTQDKVIRVAEARGMNPVLPYCDLDLAEYYFHLPEAERFNAAKREEKVLLRRLLAEEIEYDPVTIGHGFFAFDGASFFVENAAFVREEINACALWKREVGPLVDEWLAALPDRPYLFHPLLSLFTLSGWFNHSPFLPR